MSREYGYILEIFNINVLPIYFPFQMHMRLLHGLSLGQLMDATVPD